MFYLQDLRRDQLSKLVTTALLLECAMRGIREYYGVEKVLEIIFHKSTGSIGVVTHAINVPVIGTLFD